ncbi:GFA family protein [Pseudoalteromonas sp.]|uniref:GFA family protein n=1 Tax=Pseudoalteromonas sp. TaxID=53249 RepID=UPI003002C7F0
MMTYKIHCNCERVEISLSNKPIVHAFCHCEDCRELLDIPFHSVTAWKEEEVSINKGLDTITVFQHPTLNMQKHFCKHCGEVLFNTNGMNWCVVSQLLISKCNGNELPQELISNRHFFYEQRVTDIQDDLPKYLRGTDGLLYQEE